MRSADATKGSDGGVETTQTPAPGTGHRVWNWFWRGDELRARNRAKGSEGESLRQRAHLTADVARRSEDSPEPFEGNIDAILCDLYRQSIHWSRCALSEVEHGTTNAKPWDGLDHAQLGLSSEEMQRLREPADSGSFELFSALSVTEQRALMVQLRQLALALLAVVETDKRARDRLLSQRVIRVGLVTAVLAAVVGGGLVAKRWAEASGDLARDKPWRASSTYSGAAACTSPKQECDESSDFFFHTNDEDRPWLEIDLGSPQAFSAVRIENRKDCCTERAAPLAIEVSSDEHQWRTVARREATFDSWLAKFPTETARYVRVHLEKRESLHLQRVRVLR